MNPQIVIRYKRAGVLPERLDSKITAIGFIPERRRDMVISCAEITFDTKLFSSYKFFFAKIIVLAKLDSNLLDKKLIGIKEVAGGFIINSFLASGVAFKWTFSYVGFEKQRKRLNTHTIILKIEMKLKR
jgi:T-complex protein 1 subunit eta